MQYTLRDIPPPVDSELRRRAKTEGKSLNTVAIEALIRGTGLGESPLRQRDLSDIAGTWQEDPEFDRAISDQDQIDALVLQHDLVLCDRDRHFDHLPQLTRA